MLQNGGPARFRAKSRAYASVKTALAVALAWLALSSGRIEAQAQGAGGAPLSASELKRLLSGVQQRGITDPGGEPWSECMAPDGSTYYRAGPDDPGREGRLRILEPGLACFSYEDDDFGDEQCFEGYRDAAGGLSFRQPGSRLRFVILESVPVSYCPRGSELVG